jgi:hypothetical protein
MRTALLLALLTGTAAAQTGKPAPVPAAQNPPAATTRPLNLKLDGRAGDYTREAPRDATADNLPGLGEGAMDIKSLPTPRSETVRTPYPESR